MWIKIILVLLLIYMIFNLFAALKVMMVGSKDGTPMSKYIGRRVLTSAIIVTLILIAVATGLITPNPRPY
ncbi:DUF2909 domain-containing protein [Alteromonas aestuariivivens]|uniref:DUF2909 domain-containing protein n=1 Tax=Alteromonas aestuariivivens TaxID=1938339 RepID=A0A3D8M5H8_9ALTE|nr:DUF2909 domain-containing protein [Alteromonas aestuariivivens]RDV24840.1 DUF2909 domain-containing protein [Alteromonas aestuariivivens]